jgi:DNA-binding protein YbaB
VAAQRAARAAAPEAAAPAPTTDAAASHEVQVTLSGLGEVAAVRVDPAWAARTNLSRLSERVLEAFQQAYEQYDSAAGASRPAPIELSPQMQAVAADPAGTLLRYAEDLRSSLS